MLRSVLSVPQDVMDQLEYSGKLTAHDLKIINQPCEILQLFEEATNTKGELIVTSSMALVFVRSLHAGATSPTLPPLIAKLQTSIEKRL